MNEKEDDLHQFWKKYTEDVSSHPLNQEEIAAMIQTGIHRPLKTMQSSLVADLVICLGVSFWIVYTGIQRWGDWPYVLICGLLGALLIYAIKRLLQAYRNLQQMSLCQPKTILENLRKTLSQIEVESRFSTGKVLLMIIVGLSMIILIHTYYEHRPFLKVWGNLGTEDYWGLAVALVCGSVTAYGFAKWHRNRFYKKPMERIQQAIQEIEQAS
jgi:hypothetical protein